MDKKCKCGEKSCDCVSQETYTKALKATAFLADKVKILEEKYKLVLLGSDKRFNGSLDQDFEPDNNIKVNPEDEEAKNIAEVVVASQGLGLKVDEGVPLSNGKDQQIKITMTNPLPPGVSVGKNIVMEDKDIILDKEDDVCPSCGA
jgi:hypothetical protein